MELCSKCFIRYAKIVTRPTCTSDADHTRPISGLPPHVGGRTQGPGSQPSPLQSRRRFVTASIAAATCRPIAPAITLSPMDTMIFMPKISQPQVHADYDGRDIVLNPDLTLS